MVRAATNTMRINQGLVAIGGRLVAGVDVTPNAVNWGDISTDSIVYYYASKQITGINQTITLSLSYDDTNQYIYVKVGPDEISTGPWSQSNFFLGGYTSISSGTTFTVSNGQYVTFGCDYRAVATEVVPITVINQSDGNATLDTFNSSINIV